MGCSCGKPIPAAKQDKSVQPLPADPKSDAGAPAEEGKPARSVVVANGVHATGQEPSPGAADEGTTPLAMFEATAAKSAQEAADAVRNIPPVPALPVVTPPTPDQTILPHNKKEPSLKKLSENENENTPSVDPNSQAVAPSEEPQQQQQEEKEENASAPEEVSTIYPAISVETPVKEELPITEGFLSKHHSIDGDYRTELHASALSHFVDPWKKRYFRVNKHRVDYFKDKDAKTAKGSIMLEPTCLVDIASKKAQKDHCLGIYSPHHNVSYLLVGKSQEEILKWKKTFTMIVRECTEEDVGQLPIARQNSASVAAQNLTTKGTEGLRKLSSKSAEIGKSVTKHIPHRSHNDALQD